MFPTMSDWKLLRGKNTRLSFSKNTWEIENLRWKLDKCIGGDVYLFDIVRVRLSQGSIWLSNCREVVLNVSLVGKRLYGGSEAYSVSRDLESWPFGRSVFLCNFCIVVQKGLIAKKTIFLVRNNQIQDQAATVWSIVGFHFGIWPCSTSRYSKLSKG